MWLIVHFVRPAAGICVDGDGLTLKRLGPTHSIQLGANSDDRELREISALPFARSRAKQCLGRLKPDAAYQRNDLPSTSRRYFTCDSAEA